MERNIRTAEDGARQPLPRRLEATDQDLARARDAAHAVAATALGCDPGPMTLAASMSHYVYIGADVVVKLVDADGHTRLDLEIALAPHLPPGLGAPLLASGRFQNDTCDVRYACFTRMLGASPGIGLPGVDAATARRWADQAVRRLDDLHTWTPTGDAEKALRESPVEEGFVSRDLLFAEIEHMVAADREAVIPRRLIDGLTAIARARTRPRPSRHPGARGRGLGQLARPRRHRHVPDRLRTRSPRRTCRRLGPVGRHQRPAPRHRSRRDHRRHGDRSQMSCEPHANSATRPSSPRISASRWGGRTVPSGWLNGSVTWTDSSTVAAGGSTIADLRASRRGIAGPCGTAIPPSLSSW